MKQKNVILCFALTIFITLASSCIQEGRKVTALASETSSPSINNGTASFSPLPVNTPTPTPTSTAVPTLPVEKASARLLDLLAMNGGCRLPCFWGITPGKNSYQDVKTILVALSSLSYSVHLNSSGTSDVTPRLIEGDLEIYNRATFLTDENDIVHRVSFNVGAHRPLQGGGYVDVFDSKFFGETVSAYALSKVLSDQGIPSSVRISTYGGPLTRGGTGGFEILLLYPGDGILVNYTTQMQLQDTNVRGCPSNAHIEMELYPSGNSDSFFELLKQTDWAVKLSGYQPLEDVTAMSSETFYETFRQPTDICIETSIMLWPTQEP